MPIVLCSSLCYVYGKEAIIQLPPLQNRACCLHSVKKGRGYVKYSKLHYCIYVGKPGFDLATCAMRFTWRVLAARCGAQSDVSLACTQLMRTLKIAETWPVCTVCNGWVMLCWVCMGKTRFGGIIWGEMVMMRAQKFPISM